MHKAFRPVPLLIVLALFGCEGPSDPSGTTETTAIEIPANGAPVPYPQIEDNVRHDTLLVQTTFDLQDGTFIMVASNTAETFEGLRLVRYRVLPDSAADVIAISAPAYDSWTMLPSFFRTSDRASEHLVLANFGERESWGLKFMRLEKGFTDLGFLDVALPERIIEDDSLVLKRRNIGPFARMSTSGDSTVITFETDSVFLYEDISGNMDVVVPAAQVRYTMDGSGVLLLWVNGAHAKVPIPPV
jgi:hypothetical protein